MSLFLVFQESGALQTSLLKRNRRMKQRDSLPLNAATGRGLGSVFKLGEQSLSRLRRDNRGAVGAEGWVACGEGVSPSPPGEGAPDDRKYSDETVKKKLCMKP